MYKEDLALNNFKAKKKVYTCSNIHTIHSCKHSFKKNLPRLKFIMNN